MSNAPLVTVVTPVYNGQQYLEECIRSVLAQTFSEWQFVILDNVSTDNSVGIAERFAAQDERIRVIRATQFLDALDNHNRAMRATHPSSRYCKVVHADDWLYPDCLAKMVDIAERNPSVGVVSSFRLVDTRVEQQTPLRYSEQVMSGREVVRWELLGPKGGAWVTGSQTSLLFRTDLVLAQTDFYDRTFWHADTDAAYRLLMQSDFGFVHQILTFTRRHAGALMSFSQRVWSVISRDGRLILRYGPRVMAPDEYRRELRKWLWQYGSWLAKQMLKPARYRQHEFHEFHRREIGYLLAEPNVDRETQLVLRGYRRLLRPSTSNRRNAAAGPAQS